MKHQIMFSLICLCTLFLNNVFAATTCNYTNRFEWGYQCTAEPEKKITFPETAHSDSDEACKNTDLNTLKLSVCCSGYTCYNDEKPSPGINNGCFVVKENDSCYTAYFKYGENSFRYPTLNEDLSFGVGALSKYDYAASKFTKTLSVKDIYDTDNYDVETNFDRAMNFPYASNAYYGTYNPVYKTKKIALIFSDFMPGSSNGSIKAQCKTDTDKCKMVICDFGNLAECVAPAIKDVGEETKYEINGETYKIKDGKILFATKFVTPPDTTSHTTKQYEITPGEQIPLDTLKTIMNDIVKNYEDPDLIIYRLTDFTIDWQTCPAGYYCDYKEEGKTKCPNGTTSDSGSDEITDCYIDTTTNPIEFCDNNGCTKIKDVGRVFYTPKSTTTE